MEGEGATKAHADEIESVFEGTAVPQRRWEDWERSRLKKLRRDEKRRRDLERSYPRGPYLTDGGYGSSAALLRPQSDDGHWESDTISVVSSTDDDQWGTQIGAYNENGSAYPPPPTALHINPQAMSSGDTLGKDELTAMLDHGFDSRPPPVPPLPSNIPQPNRPRYQLSDGSSNGGYTPVARSPVSPLVTPNGNSSGVGSDYKTHAKRRSGSKTGADRGEWGPLGPLGPSDHGRN